MPLRLARFPGGQNDVDQTKLVLDDVISPSVTYICSLIPHTTRYRSGYSYKDSRQEHILAIKMTHENFKQLLSIASVTPALSPTESKKPVRVQWDPERTPQIGILPYRSIQIGISRAVTEKWVREWIISIEDVTERARELKRAIEVGVSNKEELMERGLMPLEREYVLEQPLRDILGMDREAR